MRAIVLAAGSGSRLNGVFDDPKCLIPVGGVPLIKRYMDGFHANGIKEVVLVLGYRAEKVLEYVQGLPVSSSSIHVIENRRHDRGSILSLWAAREWLDDHVILMDGDVYFQKGFLKTPTNSKKEDFFFIDAEAVNDGEAVMVGFKRHKAVALSRGLQGDFDLIGEWAGALKLSPKGASLFRKLLGREVASENLDEGYEFLVPRLFNLIDISYELVDHHGWVEIDFPEDIEKAEKMDRGRKETDRAP